MCMREIDRLNIEEEKKANTCNRRKYCDYIEERMNEAEKKYRLHWAHGNQPTNEGKQRRSWRKEVEKKQTHSQNNENNWMNGGWC